MFGESTLFNLDFLDNISRLVRDEHQRLENDMELDAEIFNQSNCQCATEHYEFVFEERLKKDFQSGFTQMGNELLIVGLFKHCELHLKSAVALHFPSISKTKSGEYVLLQSSLTDYAAIDELRLINNSIKHQGKVSSSLATSYPDWVLDSDLGDLSHVYARLKEKVKSYIILHEKFLKQEKLKYI